MRNDDIVSSPQTNYLAESQEDNREDQNDKIKLVIEVVKGEI